MQSLFYYQLISQYFNSTINNPSLFGLGPSPYNKSTHILTQWARKFKKVQAKELMKSNELISRIIFLTKLHFLQFQKWPKMQFHVKKIFIYLISRVFLPGLF